MTRLEVSFVDRSYKNNAIIFKAVHVDNKGKDILILSEGPTQGLDATTLTAEAKYPISFTQFRKRFVLSLHYNESNSFFYCSKD